MTGSRTAALPRGVDEAAITVLVGLMFMLQPLSTDLYLASLPGLGTRFAVPAATVQLTLTVFAVGFGLMQLVGGPLSDRFGRRPIIAGGLLLYFASALACAAAPSMAILIVARFFQAVGCCAVVVAARAIVRDAFDLTTGARALARAMSILAIGPIAGPIIGSVLEVNWGFRAAFVLQALLGALLLAITLRLLPETLARPDLRALQPAQLLRGYLAVLRSPVFRAYALAGSASYGGLFAFISGSSFVLIRVLGVPASWFGACFASVIVGFLAGTIVCRRVLASHGIVRTLALGAIVAVGSGATGAALAFAGVQHIAAVLVPAFGYVFAHGLVIPCAQAGAISAFPERAGAAAGLLGASLMVAAMATGTWIGASHDGTTLPLMATMAATGLVVLGAARLRGMRAV